MCGLVAIIDFTQQGLWTADADNFIFMLLLNSMRGWDSTGVAGIRKDGDVDVIKTVGHPFNLLETKIFAEWKLRCNYSYHTVIGHGRLATKGNINVKNAHPFQRGAVTLVHNGTLTNFDKLKKDYQDGDKIFEVDSDLIANQIHDDGVEALAKIEGAFALIWHNNKDQKVRAVRNDERPLYLMERTDLHQYYLSSDPAVFEYIRGRTGSTFKSSWKFIPAGDMLEFDKKEKTMSVVPVKFHKKVYAQTAANRGKFADPDENNYWEMWQNVIAAEKEIVDVDHVDIPKPTKKVDHIKQGGILLKLGDKINFAPMDYVEHTDPNTGETWAILKGTALVDMPVEVRARWNDKVEDILDEAVCQGIIDSITPYDQSSEFVCRVYLKKVSPVTTKSVEEPFLKLADGTNIPTHRFTALTKMPCPCGTGIIPIHAPRCLIVQSIIYCPTCVELGKFPHDA